MRSGVQIDGHWLELGDEGVDDRLSHHLGLRRQSLCLPYIPERRGLFPGATRLIRGHDIYVRVSTPVPRAIVKGAGPIRHKGNQHGENGPRRRNGSSGTDMSHHAILTALASGVKRGANKKSARRHKTPGASKPRFLKIQF